MVWWYTLDQQILSIFSFNTLKQYGGYVSFPTKVIIIYLVSRLFSVFYQSLSYLHLCMCAIRSCYIGSTEIFAFNNLKMKGLSQSNNLHLRVVKAGNIPRSTPSAMQPTISLSHTTITFKRDHRRMTDGGFIPCAHRINSSNEAKHLGPTFSTLVSVVAKVVN